MIIHHSVEAFVRDQGLEVKGLTPAQAGLRYETYCQEVLEIHAPLGYVEFRTQLKRALASRPRGGSSASPQAGDPLS